MKEEEYLPEDRLATTDQRGHRVYVHPHDLKGYWKNLRKVIYWFLIGIYLIVPWIYIGGKQVILLDLPKREFYIFGTTFYGHDGPLLIFILLGFLLFISFVTSIWGRVWCGYACPQTVFIDAFYRQIERFVEGTGPKRDKLEKGPWNFEKISKRSLKWFLYLIVSLHIVHSFLGYFVGTHNLLNITMNSPSSHMSLFITMLVMTSIILIDFGWFREQFCIIACPYGRFQSIVMDENSLVVAYDKHRGEPRKRTPGVKPDDFGDCVACNRCVHVCPTGIDIREGLQMECIACTQCIDACDEIMTKVHKPTGLIRYTTEAELDGEPKKRSPRVYIYGALLLVVMIGLFSSLSIRTHLKAQMLRGVGTPFQIVKANGNDSIISNHYRLILRYYGDEKINFYLKTKNEYKDFSLITPSDDLSITNENKEFTVFIQFNESILIRGEKDIEVILLNSKDNTEITRLEVPLVGPIR